MENLENMSFAASDIQFCKFLTTPIVVKYTYTVLNKLSWIGKSHESDLCCYIKVFHVLHGSTKGTTRIVLSVTDYQEKKVYQMV